MVRILIIAIVLFPVLKSNGQMLPYDSLKAAIEKEIQFIDSYNFSDVTEGDTDIESLVMSTSKKIVNLLSRNESSQLKTNPLHNLELATSYGDSLIRIYTFSLYSGGSRGSINYPIIQWKKPDGSFGAYNLSKKINSHFYEIIKLKSKYKNLFLVFGVERGNISHIYYTVFIMQFNKDYLILDYPALFGFSNITYVNSDLSFDERDQILKIELHDSFDIELPRDMGITQDEENKIYERIKQSFKDEWVSELRFDGIRFVRK